MELLRSRRPAARRSNGCRQADRAVASAEVPPNPPAGQPAVASHPPPRHPGGGPWADL